MKRDKQAKIAVLTLIAALALPLSGQTLPQVVIRCANEINGTVKVPAEMKIEGVYDGAIGIKLRGNSSQSFNQKKYTIETRTDDQEKKDVSIFGMPAEHEWVLMCPYNDVSMMRDAFACQLWNEMGHWGPHFKMVEVTLNDEYIGVYGFAETITKNRIDEIRPKKVVENGKEKKVREFDPEEIGYLVRIDKYDASDLYFTSKHQGIRGGGQMMGGFGFEMPGMNNIIWTCRYPKQDKISEAQWDYIRQFIHNTENAMLTNGTMEEMQKWIDLQSFIDYFIHTELSLNADAYKSSSYFYKTPGKEDGRLFAGPVWDYNLAYGCCSFCNAADINAWAFDGCETSPTPAFWKLFATNPWLKSLVDKRYKELRKTVLSDKHILSIVDSYANQLSKVQAKQFDKYPELLKKSGTTNDSQNQNSGFGGMFGFGNIGLTGGMLDWFRSYTVESYDEEIQYLKNWLTQRLKIMDERF